MFPLCRRWIQHNFDAQFYHQQICLDHLFFFLFPEKNYSALKESQSQNADFRALYPSSKYKVEKEGQWLEMMTQLTCWRAHGVLILI